MQALCSRREYCTEDIVRKLTARPRPTSCASSHPNACATGTSRASSTALAPSLSAAQIQEIIQSLKKDKFLDDARYARAFVRDKSSLAGWGSRKIRFALLAKGIDEETIAQAFHEIDADQAQNRLYKLMEVKYRSLKKEPTPRGNASCDKLREKMLRFGLSRGYSYDEVLDCIQSLLAE